MKNILFSLVILLVFSCKTKDPAPAKSTQKNILSFSFTALAIDAMVDTLDNRISAVVPSGTDVTKLAPTVSVSAKATISPGSGVVQDFTKPVVYTVTAEDGSTSIFTATVTVESSAPSPTLAGMWKVELYLEGKLQATDSVGYLRFDDDGTFEYSQQRMVSQNDSVWVDWDASTYLSQTYAQFRSGSSQAAEDLDELNITETDAPFFLTFPDGGFSLQYKPSAGGLRVVYGNDLIFRSLNDDTLALYPLISNNLLEIRLTRM